MRKAFLAFAFIAAVLPVALFAQAPNTPSKTKYTAFEQYCLVYQEGDEAQQQELCSEYWNTPEYATAFEMTYGFTVEHSAYCSVIDPLDAEQPVDCEGYWQKWEPSSTASQTIFLYDSSVEQIESFASDFELKKDGSVAIKETIVYNFGTEKKHGIFRDIPIVYREANGGKVRIDIADISVQDEKGTPYTFTDFKNGNDRRIKIGDPDIFIEGTHTYAISYTVPRAVGFYEDFDEVYWNVTGNNWPVLIRNAVSTVTVPTGADLRIACYAGAFGSTKACEFAQRNTDNESARASVATVTFKQANLSPNEGLTVAVGFPKGVITEPTASEKVSSWLHGMLGRGGYFFLLPFLVFYFAYRKWAREGKNPPASKIIIPHYEAPDNLSPLQTAFVLKGTSPKRIVAEIVHLAMLGYVKIIRKDSIVFFVKDAFELVLLKRSDATLLPFQSKLLDYLFPGDKKLVKLTTLRRSFYSKALKVCEAAQQGLIDRGYFPLAKHKLEAQFLYTENRASTVIFTNSFAMIFGGIIGGLFIGGSLGEEVGWSFFIAWALSLIIWSIFIIIMPTVTVKGQAARDMIKGFKMYLSVAEKDRINFHDAPAKNPETFQKFLAYAIALGVEKEWAKVFEDITMTEPDWYSDASGRPFSSHNFISDISSFSRTGSSSMGSAPGSSGSGGSGGGGSSGGGGGGGGGGSW